MHCKLIKRPTSDNVVTQSNPIMLDTKTYYVSGQNWDHMLPYYVYGGHKNLKVINMLIHSYRFYKPLRIKIGFFSEMSSIMRSSE